MNTLITEKDEIIENIHLIRQTVCDVTALEQEQDKLRSESYGKMSIGKK